MKFAKFAMVATATFFLAGCGEPAATDDDIKLLLGDEIDIKKIEECPRILSGLDQGIYKDMPKEMFGMISIDCRKIYKEWLDDPARNPKKLTMAILEDKKFAERVTAVRNERLQAARQKAEQERNERIEATKSRMRAAIEESNRFLANFDATKADIAVKCGEWSELDAKLKAAGIRGFRMKPYLCNDNLTSPKENVERDIKTLADELNKDPAKNMFWGADKSSTLKFLDENRGRLDIEIEKLKAALPQ